MSISPQTLQNLFAYLANFWGITAAKVQEEYQEGKWTYTENDPENPTTLTIDHQTRTDLVVTMEDL